MTHKMKSWTEANYNEMSWHDNAVHSFQIVEGEYGSGLLRLDIDYILEWLRSDDSRFTFRIVQAELTFKDVTNLKIDIDYSSVSAGVAPLSLNGINRRSEFRDRYIAQIWTLDINWPSGEISFESSGFNQTAIGEIIVTDAQVLMPHERTSPFTDLPG